MDKVKTFTILFGRKLVLFKSIKSWNELHFYIVEFALQSSVLRLLGIWNK